MDFFAGSCTTGDAVIRQSAEDGVPRSFICIDLPFPTEEGSVARSEGFLTTSAVGAERLRRVGKQVGKGEGVDVGFRHLSLGTSNFKLWDSAEVPTDEEKLGEQLMAFAESVLDGVSDEGLLFEIILKSGIVLSAEVEPLPDGKTFAVEGGLVVSLAEPVTEELVDAIAEREPDRVVFLDRGFASDADRANTTIRLRKAGIEVRVV